MDVDSDSEVEILTTTNGGTPKSPKTNGTSVPAAGRDEASATINPQVESKLKKMAKVELLSLSGV